MPRNSQGQYFLPDGNPVIAGSLIESDWANKTMEDLGQAISDSLDRDGQGGMRAPLRGIAGSSSSPAFSFVNDARTGFFLSDQGVLGVSTGGVNPVEFSNNGFQVKTGYQAFQTDEPTQDTSLTNRKYVNDTVNNAISTMGIVGEIRMFSSPTILPSGWHICDGSNGTVDLRDRFIVASGSKFGANTAGGSFTIGINQIPSHDHSGATTIEDADHNHSMASGVVSTAGDHSHGVSDPGHTHSYGYPGIASGMTGGQAGIPNTNNTTGNSKTGIGIQNGGNHTHTLSGSTLGVNANHKHGITAQGGGQEYIQPYYALIFAQYTGV